MALVSRALPPAAPALPALPAAPPAQAEGGPIPADEVHVWVIDTGDVPVDADDAGQLGLLAEQELARARRFTRPADRQAFVGTHAAMRQILAGYLGVPPHDIVYEYDCVVCGKRHGKPSAVSLSGSGDAVPLAFNMARSGELGVVAVAATGRVGVDIERLGQDVEMTEVVEFFAPAERVALADAPERERRRRGILTWTRKEAYLKALGTGLSRPLDGFEVSVPPDAPHLVRPADGDEATWTMAELPLPEPYAGTVVAEGAVGRMRCVPWGAPAATQ